MELLIIISSILAASLIAFAVVMFYNHKYKKFVLNNSEALKVITVINKNYQFKHIKNFDLSHSYDNRNFYNDISCKDYLTYQLVYIQYEVDKAINDIIENKKIWNRYATEVNSKISFGLFGEVKQLKNTKKLLRVEKKIFRQKTLHPCLNFSINVALHLTNINGKHLKSKYYNFQIEDIKAIEKNLRKKKGSRYLDDDIWNSLCRVERGKVTNRMRFAIYKRDHYRCRKCGRKTNDLEVDHIIPIAKGGKSTFDNLQTLCHRCNVIKGSNIE